MKKIVLSTLIAGLTLSGIVFAETLQSSKAAVTETIIAKPAKASLTEKAFDGQRLSSKGNSTARSISVASTGKTDKTQACSKPMLASTCTQHCM